MNYMKRLPLLAVLCALLWTCGDADAGSTVSEASGTIVATGAGFAVDRSGDTFHYGLVTVDRSRRDDVLFVARYTSSRFGIAAIVSTGSGDVSTDADTSTQFIAADATVFMENGSIARQVPMLAEITGNTLRLMLDFNGKPAGGDTVIYFGGNSFHQDLEPAGLVVGVVDEPAESGDTRTVFGLALRDAETATIGVLRTLAIDDGIPATVDAQVTYAEFNVHESTGKELKLSGPAEIVLDGEPCIAEMQFHAEVKRDERSARITIPACDVHVSMHDWQGFMEGACNSGLAAACH